MGERLVEFPLWEEYGELIKSEVGDIKNIGGTDGGAITAGKFLQHFTDYPFIHLDIAGPAFSEKPITISRQVERVLRSGFFLISLRMQSSEIFISEVVKSSCLCLTLCFN